MYIYTVYFYMKKMLYCAGKLTVLFRLTILGLICTLSLCRYYSVCFNASHFNAYSEWLSRELSINRNTTAGLPLLEWREYNKIHIYFAYSGIEPNPHYVVSQHTTNYPILSEIKYEIYLMRETPNSSNSSSTDNISTLDKEN